MVEYGPAQDGLRRQRTLLKDGDELHKNQTAREFRPDPVPANQTEDRCKRAACHPADKFVMFEGWRPSSGLRGTACKIGIELSGPPDPARLADFVTFWEADGAAYNQIQWEMKLARYLEKGRTKPAIKNTGERRDCTMVASTDYVIPEGFRGG